MSTDYKNSGKYALGYHLHLAFIALTETLNQELHRLGLKLTHPQFTILQAVFRQPGLNQSELARATAKDGAAIARSVAYLEKQGLLERKWINGCAKGVFTTAKAEELRSLLEKAIQQTLDKACSEICEDKIEDMNRILQQIRITLTTEK